jgi:septal ring factor EnvC (AmiA/AmiB activator)
MAEVLTMTDFPKKPRSSTTPGVTAVPHEIPFEPTGVHYRLKRMSEQHESVVRRLGSVETDMKSVKDDVSEIKAAVASVDGRLEGIGVAIDAFKVAVATTNTHIRADIDVSRVRAITETEDAADAKKTRRKLLAKLIGAAIGGTGIVATVIAIVAEKC